MGERSERGREKLKDPSPPPPPPPPPFLLLLPWVGGARKATEIEPPPPHLLLSLIPESRNFLSPPKKSKEIPLDKKE